MAVLPDNVAAQVVDQLRIPDAGAADTHGDRPGRMWSVSAHSWSAHVAALSVPARRAERSGIITTWQGGMAGSLW
jgi:hypothetical protein